MKIEQVELNYQEQDCLNYRYYHHLQKVNNPKSVVDSTIPYSIRNPIIKNYKQYDPLTQNLTTNERAEISRKHQIQMHYLKQSINNSKPSIKSYHEKPICTYVNVRYKQRDEESRLHNIQLNYLHNNVRQVQSPYRQSMQSNINLSQRNKREIFIYQDYQKFRIQHLEKNSKHQKNTQMYQSKEIQLTMRSCYIKDAQNKALWQQEFYQQIQNEINHYNLKNTDDYQQFFARIYFNNYLDVDVDIILFVINKIAENYFIPNSLKFIKLEMNNIGLTEYGHSY
ncbi:hypothetical protein SS50377_22404 [Spironucleus salmonicida]|uniref:Uncharacterized protein n=1 Tax=Spironucleus salmonicida TaxID=348837 RepID=V6LCA4_9EUKA|nr:hypothetical protein SS50377_22404 [Spironucleus salmonicida]|eukprot:EST42102.1 Hypothetical protein SS50377_18411 [Spironucleus salmonicida]